MPDIRDELIIHQRENEVHFLASAFAIPAAVLEDCAWLRPDMLVDPDVADFWKQLLDHGNSMRAANNTGIMNKIISASQNTPNIHFYAEFARAIAEDYALGQIMEKLGTIARFCGERNMAEVNATLEDIRSTTMLGFNAGLTANEAGLLFEGLVNELLEGRSLAVKTNIPELDNKLGGLFKGEFTTLAARPGVGKTALMLEIARNVSMHELVNLFSLEMKAGQVWARMACPYAGCDWTDVRIGNVSKEQLRKLKIASEELRYKYGKNLIIVDDVYTIEGIHQICSQYRPGLVLIDQLAEFLWHDPKESKVSWYGKVVKYLRHYVCLGLDVPLIMNHQLNRAVEGLDDKRPQLAHLRDSGEVEQRSDNVLLMYRQDLYDGRGPEQWDVPVEIKIAKNRQGESGGVAVLNYNLKEQWFS